MVLDDFTRVLLGQLPAEEFVSPFNASIMYFIITMLMGWTLRAINHTITPEPLKSYVGSFLATLEMCAYFFENNFIFKNFGSVWLFIAVIIQCFIANRTYFGNSENPCHAFTQLLEKKISITEGLIRIGVQTLAGLASYRFARTLWSLDMVPDHRERYLETACASDLNVTFLVGFLIEMGATSVDTWMGRQTLLQRSVVDELIKLATGSLMIVLGINMTGMYFNPAMASGHTYGCYGNDAWEHFFVYWAGPFVGCYVAVAIDKMVHIDVVEMAKDRKKKAS
ncbi:aquaporin-11-like [Mya arenaria]|uniref:aquaporin-11-like n=1 Tax=Mya arenaria TaxID=6604 RepID=UPI0022E19976|nr:aquaporin-11-like [Mya arenaria]